MINRAYIHIAGQPGAGKTTLLAAALGAMQYEKQAEHLVAPVTIAFKGA